MKQRNHFFEIRESSRIFEVWAPDDKEATHVARFKKWAASKSHVGLRRILRTVPGEPWPVLVEEANYLTAARDGAEKNRASEELKRQAAAGAPERMTKRKAAEDAAYALRVEQMRVEREVRRKKLEPLDDRLGRSPLLPTLPRYDPETCEWI